MAKVKIQGFPAKGIVDIGDDITNMSGRYFERSPYQLN